MKLSQVLPLAKPALETNQVYAEVVRPLGGTKFEYLTFAPREIASGVSDIELKARDQIRLYTTAPAAMTAAALPAATASAPAPATTAPAATAPASAAALPVASVPAATATPVDPVQIPVDPVKSPENLFPETVTVSGSVRYIGPYARTPSLKLSSIITTDQLLEETSLEYAELTRFRADGTQEYLAFAPKDVLDGTYDLALRARDSIRLIPKTGFKGAKAVADLDKFADSIQLTGQVARPEIFAFRKEIGRAHV